MYPEKIAPISAVNAWRKTAKSRLRFELAGLAFACKKGFRPEEYARHLWSKGAVRWTGKAKPSAAEYLLKEAKAFRECYPGISFAIVAATGERVELVFTDGCLGGWAKDHWALARSLGLTKKEICAYCHESFLVWAEQLGLAASIGPQGDGICRLRVVKPSGNSDEG